MTVNDWRNARIEEAAITIREADGALSHGDAVLYAEAALTVFEKAHTPEVIERHDLVMPIYEDTPTDDEREALAIVQGAKAAYLEAYPGDDHRERFEALDRLAAGFRRTEVPEPTAEKVFCNCGSVMVRADQSDAFTLTCPKDRCGGFRLVYKRSPEPQGEPSDAQVAAALAELRGINYWAWREIKPEDLRAALRAAGEAR